MRSFIVVLVVLVVGVIAWRISELLSPDAIGMALGMAFGVLAGLPAAALVIVATSRRTPDYGDDYEPPTINVDPTCAAEDVTPYTHLFRRAVNLQPLLPRQDPDAVLRTYRAQMEEPGPEGVPPWLRS